MKLSPEIEDHGEQNHRETHEIWEAEAEGSVLHDFLREIGDNHRYGVIYKATEGQHRNITSWRNEQLWKRGLNIQIERSNRKWFANSMQICKMRMLYVVTS